MSDTKFTIDASQAFAQLDGIDRALGELETKFRAMPTAVRAAFQSNVAGKFERDLSGAEKAVEDVKKELDGVAPKATAAFNTKDAEKFAKAVTDAERATESLNKERAKQPPRGGIDGAAAGLAGVNKQASLGTSLFRGLAGAAAGAFAAFSFAEAIRGGVALNVEYERVRTSLTVLLKDAENADALLGKLNQFAAETPFQTDQINQAATSLLAFGESEQTVIDRLREIGTLSAGTGKDFNELTSIYGKARVAGVLYAEDINQLVEAGIPIIQEFAKQMGVSESQVKKLASEGKIGFNQLQTAFENLTTGDGQFAGLLEAQSKTLGGQLSTLKDNASQLLRVFTGFIGLPDGLKSSFGPLSEIIGGVTKSMESGEAATGRFGGVVNGLVAFVNGAKTSFQFLGETIRTVYELVLAPLARLIFGTIIPALQSMAVRVGEFIEYAKDLPVIGAGFGALSNLVYAFRQILESVPATFAGFRAAARQAVDNVVGYFEGLVRSAKIVAKELDLAISIRSDTRERLRAEIAELKKQEVAAAKAGKSVGQAYTEARNAALKETKPEADKLVANAVATPKATAAQVAQATGGKSSTEIAFDNRGKDLAKRRILLNDLEDGLQKELEAVRLHFDQLRLEYDKAGLDTSGLLAKQQAAEQGVFVSALQKQLETDASAVKQIRLLGQQYVNDQAAQAEQIKVIRDNEIREAQARANALILEAQSAGASRSEVEVLISITEKQLTERRIVSEQEYSKAISEVRKTTIEQQKRDRDAEIDLQEERGKGLVLIAKKSGADETKVQRLQVELDAATKQARLQSELEFQTALLALVDSGNEEQAKAIQDRINLIKAQIQTLNLDVPTPDAPGRDKPISILELMGIDPDSGEGAAIQEAVSMAISSLQQLTAARVAATDAALAESERLVDAKQTELDNEIALAEAGFASNVALKRRELEEAKKARDKAQEDQRKAQRAQILLDSAVQVSGLATSAANIFKSLSALGPIGVGLAVASIATMFFAFAKAKSDALKATKARYGLAGFIDKGGLVHGKSHAQGGQHLEVEGGELLQVADDGGRRRVSVVRRERVKEYMDLLDAANTGDKERLAAHAFSLAGIDPRTVNATDAQTAIVYHIPQTRKEHITRTVERRTRTNTTITTTNTDTRSAALLEAILFEMRKGNVETERWTPDGKTRMRGNVKTKYMN